MTHLSSTRLNRRGFLGAGIASTLGLALSPAFQKLLAAEAPKRRARACILLWLNGGPSHLDTFDPKPGTETGGPFKSIKSKVPGLDLCEHLPKLAEQARHLAVIRSITSREADHDRAFQYLHTGNQRDETVEHPSLGAVVAREWAAEDGDLPSFVSINGNSFGPGFFGVEYAPHLIGNLDAPIDNVALPEGVDEKRMDRRLKALAAFNGGFAKRADRESVAEHERFTAKAVRFRKSSALQAFDLKDEKPETLAAYGVTVPKEGEDNAPNVFGKACVMARRLVEHGVRFVEVTLDGWDTHADNFNQVAALCKQLDPAFAGLLGDLSQRGLLDQTLVMCMGEFGRTPTINAQTGRDHWSEAFSAVLAGGGVKCGQVIGASDAKGEQPKDHPVAIPDLYATLMNGFGVDPAKLYRSPGGRPIKLADKGKVMQDLFRS
jgi:hypothetical protein